MVKLFLDDILREIPLNTVDSSFLLKISLMIGSVKEYYFIMPINLKINQDEYDKKVNDYKNSLIIYNYEQQLVDQNLDTVITFDQIQNYYINNRKILF